MFSEPKILRGLGKVGHIEDIVIDETYRGKNLGAKLIELLTRVAFEIEKAYKVVLNCKPDRVPFYEKLSYKKNEQMMALYSDDFKEPKYKAKL